MSAFFDKNALSKYTGDACELRTPDARDTAFYCAAAAAFFGDFEKMPKEGELGHGLVAPGFQAKAWVDHLASPRPAMYLYTNLVGRMMASVHSLPGWVQEKLMFL